MNADFYINDKFLGNHPYGTDAPPSLYMEAPVAFAVHMPSVSQDTSLYPAPPCKLDTV
jgi:hypothetical protein